MRPATGSAADLIFLPGLWCLVTGTVRFLMLVRPFGAARAMVAADIAAGEFEWDTPPLVAVLEMVSLGICEGVPFRAIAASCGC